MALVGFLIITLITLATVRFSAFEFTNSATFLLHNACLRRLPLQAISLAELQALVCGQSFAAAKTSELYIASGLIHLFVVSGAHLILIEKMLLKFFKRFQFASTLILPFLLAYAIACNLNPPVTRSLIAISVGLLTLKHHLRWPENYKIFITGLLALLFNPAWLTSVSLQLSWLAALVVSINSLYFFDKNVLFRQSVFFFVLAPLLAFFQMPNPLTILMNIIFSPVLEFILFPMGLLVWLVPPLFVIFDWIILVLRFFLSASEVQTYSAFNFESQYMIGVGWAIILTLQFYLHFKEMDQRRDEYV